MRIEDIGPAALGKVSDQEVRGLRFRFMQLWPKFKEGAESVFGFSRREFLGRYGMLRQEMAKRAIAVKIPDDIDRAVEPVLVKSGIWKIDVPALGEHVVVENAVSLGGAFAKNPRQAADVEVIIKAGERDEALEAKLWRILKDDLRGLEPRFIYSPAGPDSSFIPLFDLVMRPKAETEKVAARQADAAKRYDPSQPRAADGRWGTGDGKLPVAHDVDRSDLAHLYSKEFGDLHANPNEKILFLSPDGKDFGADDRQMLKALRANGFKGKFEIYLPDGRTKTLDDEHKAEDGAVARVIDKHAGPDYGWFYDLEFEDGLPAGQSLETWEAAGLGDQLLIRKIGQGTEGSALRCAVVGPASGRPLSQGFPAPVVEFIEEGKEDPMLKTKEERWREVSRLLKEYKFHSSDGIEPIEMAKEYARGTPVDIGKRAIPPHDFGLAEAGAAWDAGAETRGASAEDLLAICAWYDAEKPNLLGSYKLPHHRRSDKKAVWAAVANCAAVMAGARGGVDIPAADRAGVLAHLRFHYDQFKKEPPKDLAKAVILKPFPNEYACRMRDPGDFEPDSFRRMTRDHDGKKYSVIMARLKGESTMTEQTYRYDRADWTEADARAHCKSHGGKSFEPATGMAKAEEPRRLFRILKVNEDERTVGGVIYEPKVADTQGDWTDKTQIRQAMFHFMEKYAEDPSRIKVMHEGKTYFFPVLECFQPEEDTHKGGTDEAHLVKAGSWWLMVHVENDAIWQKVKDGELGGFSMGGTAVKGNA